MGRKPTFLKERRPPELDAEQNKKPGPSPLPQPAEGAPTWRYPGGDGRGGHLALALGGHGGHLDGVGGERGEARDAVLQGGIGQVVCHAGVGSVVLLPGDPVPWGDPTRGTSLAVAMSRPRPLPCLSLILHESGSQHTSGALGPRGADAWRLGPQVRAWRDAPDCRVGVAGKRASHRGCHLTPVAEELGCAPEWTGWGPPLGTF